VSFKQEVDVRPELDPLARGHGQEPVVVKDRVEGLDPFRVDVPVAHNPRMHFLQKFRVVRRVRHKSCTNVGGISQLETY